MLGTLGREADTGDINSMPKYEIGLSQFHPHNELVTPVVYWTKPSSFLTIRGPPQIQAHSHFPSTQLHSSYSSHTQSLVLLLAIFHHYFEREHCLVYLKCHPLSTRQTLIHSSESCSGHILCKSTFYTAMLHLPEGPPCCILNCLWASVGFPHLFVQGWLSQLFGPLGDPCGS